MDGFISLHRKFLEWEWHRDAHVVLVWNHLLLLANYRPKEWHGIVVGRGQLVSSVRSLSELVGLSQKQIRISLGKLKRTGEIAIKGTNKYSIITICKYDCYQQDTSCEGQAKGQTNGQATGQQHNKTINNNKEVNRLTSMSNSSPSTLTEQVDFDAFRNYWNEKMRDKSVRSIVSITSNRKKMIHARVAEYGKEALMKVVEKTSASKFLNGDNTRGFIADFTWVIRPTNFLKILEGNYDNR